MSCTIGTIKVTFENGETSWTDPETGAHWEISNPPNLNEWEKRGDSSAPSTKEKTSE